MANVIVYASPATVEKTFLSPSLLSLVQTSSLRGKACGKAQKLKIMSQRKPLPPTYFFLAIAAMAALHHFLPLTSIIAYPLNLIGGIPLLAGAILNILADNALKAAHTTVKPFQESNALLTSGVYRFSRHPMYLGMVLILLGLALVLGSLSPYIVIVIFAIAMERIFIQTEEHMLAHKFGDHWLDYTQRVRRWI
jgi:protein-S-isoprenylcysteine O-methyltransferase Ste14